MATKKLHSREIIGKLFHELRPEAGPDWVADLSGAPLSTDQESETFGGVGAIPQLRKWKGKRMGYQLRDFSYRISVDKYELTLYVMGEEIRRDKTGQVDLRISELRRRWEMHWSKLATDAILAGATAVGYDGIAFFGTHTENGVTTGDNDITVTGSATPTVAALKKSIWSCIDTFTTFKDDQSEPAHFDPKDFVVMIPPGLGWMESATGALGAATILEGGQSATNTLLLVDGYSFRIVQNPRLSSWTTNFAMFVRDGRSLIRLSEVDLKISAKAEGSEYEHDYDAHEYGLMTSRGLGYGDWKSAIRVTLSAS